MLQLEREAVPRGDRLVFTVGSAGFRRSDLVAAAEAWGEWARLVQAVREELACDGRSVEAGEVTAAANGFRRARGLLAAEDLETWLAERDVSVADWLSHVRRSLLRDRGGIPDTLPPASGQGVWVRAICSGVLGELAERLAAGAACAAAQAIPVDPASPARLDAARERLGASAATEAALGRELGARRLEWTSVDCRTCLFPDSEVAAEAALCVREDGRAFEDVAGEAAGVETRRVRLLAGELEPDLAAALLAAEPGELVGPVEVRGGSRLALIEAKTPPSSADPELRARAAAIVAARAVARAVDEHVRWHERL